MHFRCVLFSLLSLCILFPLDRITFRDGTTLTCTIHAQTGDSISYFTDEAVQEVAKELIASVQLDIEIDKYYIAAEKTSDPERKIQYFLQSISNFPGQDYHHTLDLRRTGCTYVILDKYHSALSQIRIIRLRYNLLTLDEIARARTTLAPSRVEADDQYSLNSALFFAVKRGDLASVITNCMLGADPAFRRKNSLPVEAALTGNKDIFEYLIARVDPSADLLQGGITMLMLYAACGATEKMKPLITSTSVNDTTVTGESPLIFAARGGKKDVVQILLNAGARIDPKGITRVTPLMLYAAAGMQKELEEEIQKNSGSIQTDKYGMTALHWSVLSADTDILNRLIQAGYSVTNTKAVPFFSMLYPPIERKENVMFMHLIRSGVPFESNHSGVTPLNAQIGMGNYEMVKFLLDNRAEINVLDTERSTPLMNACRTGNAAVVRLLLERGADPNVRDFKGRTALSISAELAWHECVKILKEAGASERFNDWSAAERVTLFTNGAAKYPDFLYYRSLDLSASDADDNFLKTHVSKLSNLQILYCVGLTNISAGGVAAALQHLPEIKELHLSHSTISDKGFSDLLPRLGKIETIGLAGTDVSDTHVPFLIRHMKNCKMAIIEGSMISPSGAKKILDSSSRIILIPGMSREQNEQYFNALDALEKKYGEDIYTADIERSRICGITPGMRMDEVRIIYSEVLAAPERSQKAWIGQYPGRGKNQPVPEVYNLPYCTVSAMDGIVTSITLKNIKRIKSPVKPGDNWEKTKTALPAPGKSQSRDMYTEHFFHASGFFIQITVHNTSQKVLAVVFRLPSGRRVMETPQSDQRSLRGKREF